MPTTLGDPGKLIQAQHQGNCAECGGTIVPGQPIYFSRANGSRHKRCVEPGETAAPASERAPRAARDERPGPPRDDRPRDLFDAPRARDAAVAPAAGDDAYVATNVGGDGYRAPARDTEFSRAGDRDAARRELAGVLRLLIEALVRIERLLD